MKETLKHAEYKQGKDEMNNNDNKKSIYAEFNMYQTKC